MSFLMRGRSPWWWSDQSHPREADRVPEPATAATGLPVAAPTPAGVTDDLSASGRLNRASVQRLVERHRTDTTRCACCDGTPADRLWATGELRSLEQLAELTERHGPWEAARRMYAARTASANVRYRLTLRGQR